MTLQHSHRRNLDLRSAGLAVLLLLQPLVARSADTTADLLRAPHVRKALYIRPTQNNKTLIYSIDGLDVGKPFLAEPTFAADDSVALIFPSYNPLKYQLSGDAKDTDDPNFLQLRDFISKLGDLQKLITGAAASSTPSSTAATPSPSMEAAAPVQAQAPPPSASFALAPGSLADAELLDDDRRFVADLGKRGKPLTCADFMRLLHAAARIILKSEHVATTADIQRWVDGAVGKQGVTAVASDMRLAASKLDAQVTEAHNILLLLTGPILHALEPPATVTDAAAAAAWRQVVREFASTHPEQVLETLLKRSNVKGKTTGKVEVEEPCQPPTLSSLSALVALANRAGQFFTIKVNLKESLLAIADRLAAILKDNDWVPSQPGSQAGYETDYVFSRPPISSQKSTSVVITMSTVDVRQSANDLTTTLKVTTAATQRVTIRAYQLLVPEAALAMAYSGLRVPSYGTGTDSSGRTVVQSGGSTSASLSAAAFLNAVIKTTEYSWCYPMLQMGINLSSDAPALLLGGGFRLTSPDKVGVAGGLAIGWIKDLDKLTAGAPVSGTAAIQDDLKRTLRFSYYIALQYHF